MSVREDDTKFIADFYTYAFVGLMLEWIDKGMVEKPAVIIEGLGMFIQGDITIANERFGTKYKK